MTVVRLAAIAVIFLCLGAATAAGVFAFIPNPGSPPSIFDDFKWSSISNGYWHVYAAGGTARINYSILTLHGDTIEMDHRLQTDPYRTVVVVKIRATHFGKFSIGLGAYHSTAVSFEFDVDGAKCLRPSKEGTQIDILQPWLKPPTHRWFYLMLTLTNPYPYATSLTPAMTKPVTVACSLYGAHRQLLVSHRPITPPTELHYAAIDLINMRTWDTGNNYQVDWIYAGPASGSPLPVR
ncbi:MAG TPA: hypothetical protein VFB58_12145 [Chloroflexota bacterium]|nr:hypothetical protein [Chloroflexota bacterium]